MTAKRKLPRKKPGETRVPCECGSFEWHMFRTEAVMLTGPKAGETQTITQVRCAECRGCAAKQMREAR